TLEIANWNPPPSGRKGPRPRGTAKFHLSGVELSRIAAAVSTPRLPLEKIELAGRVSGDISSAWTGSPEKAVSDLKLDVNPPANPTAREVPVTAQLQAVYHGDIRTLDVAGLSLATRAIRVNATGELGSDKAQARVSLNATDLRELQPALDALNPATRLPGAWQARASFNGAVFGRLAAPRARGHLELEKFDTEFSLAASSGHVTAERPPRRLHWDALSADISYTPSLLTLQRGTLRRSGAQIGFSLSAGLRQGDFDPNASQINASLPVPN